MTHWDRTRGGKRTHFSSKRQRQAMDASCSGNRTTQAQACTLRLQQRREVAASSSGCKLAAATEQHRLRLARYDCSNGVRWRRAAGGEQRAAYILSRGTPPMAATKTLWAGGKEKQFWNMTALKLQTCSALLREVCDVLWCGAYVYVCLRMFAPCA